MSTDEIVEAYLRRLGVVLWPGEAWDVSDPKERAKAAAWFNETMKAILVGQ